MFSFLKRNRTPEEFLAHMLDKLENMAEHKKLAFVEKNIVAIKDAMMKDPQAVPHYQGRMIEAPEFSVETMEWSLGYLEWYSPLLFAMDDENDALDLQKLSPAATYFIKETKHNLQLAFAELFKLYPMFAIINARPSGLLRKDIVRAMEDLAYRPDPYLYFDCYDAIGGIDREEGEPSIAGRLVHATTAALRRLLDKDPQALLFPLAFERASGYRYRNRKENYLSYLPEGIHRQRFITDHMATIAAETRAIAQDANNEHLQDVNNICEAFPEETRPEQLTALKNLMLSERVKTCFRLAASDDRSQLSDMVLALDREKTKFARIYSCYKDEPFTPAFELLCLTNPSAPPTAEDKDLGADSKHLWMIRESDDILAAAFSKASLAGYLTVQTRFSVKEMRVHLNHFDHF